MRVSSKRTDLSHAVSRWHWKAVARLAPVWLFVATLCPIGVGKGEEVIVEEILVTGTRVPQARDEKTVAAPISRLSREEIEAAGVPSLPEALSLLEGFHLTDTIGFGYGSVRLHQRGAGEFDHGVTLLDGVPLNDPADNSVSWREFPLEVIESVEVLRGGVSSTFGETLSGVVQLRLPEAVEEPASILRAGTGTFGRGRTSFTSLLGDEESAYLLHAGYEDIGGYREKSGFAGENVFFSSSTPLKEGMRLKVVGNFHKQEHTVPGALSRDQYDAGPKQPGSFIVGFDTNATHLSARWEWQSEGGTLSLLPYVRERATRSLDNSGGEGSTNVRRRGAVLQYAWQAKAASYTAGLEAGRSQYENSQRGSPFDLVDKESLALFADLTAPVGQYFNFSASLRFDRSDYNLKLHECGWDGTKCTYPVKFQEKRKAEGTSPKIGLTFNPSADHTLYASWSRAFLAPTGFQFTGMTAPFLANPNIEPQVAGGVEVGWRGKLGEGLSASVNVFSIRTDREIFFNPGTFANENLDTKRSGVEASLTRRRAGRLSTITYTHLQAKFDQSFTFFDTNIDGKSLPLAPKHRLTFRHARDLGEWTAALSGTWVSNFFPLNDLANFRQSEGYTLWNLQFVRSLPQGRFVIELNNLTDEKISSFPATNGRDPSKDTPECAETFTCFRENFRPLPAFHLFGGVEWRF